LTPFLTQIVLGSLHIIILYNDKPGIFTHNLEFVRVVRNIEDGTKSLNEKLTRECHFMFI